MLDHCDLVVINPILGPKKPDDLNTERLKFIYNNILKPRFYNRILFIPLRANMFYAGPREAVHHSLIREWLGFSHFSVGRDHAGSDNFYRPEEAKNTLKRYQDLFNIKNGIIMVLIFVNLVTKLYLKVAVNIIFMN